MVSPELFAAVGAAVLSGGDLVLSICHMWMTGDCRSECCGASITHNSSRDDEKERDSVVSRHMSVEDVESVTPEK